MKRIGILLGVVIIFLLGAFTISQLVLLQKAHSTFGNYYAFRGCTQLLKRTDTYSICKTSHGETLTLVKFENKWYLDGDLPPCIFRYCL